MKKREPKPVRYPVIPLAPEKNLNLNPQKMHKDFLRLMNKPS